MKTDVQPGNTITLSESYAVVSGDGQLVEPVETALVGVFDITKVGS